MVKEDIETVIDRLLAFVQANKETTLDKAANAMALPQTQVEKLALLLEENGLLTINYSLTSTKLLSKEFTDSQAKQSKKKIESKKDSLIEESEEAEREVLTAETLLSFIERDVTRRLQVAEKLLVDLESKKGYSREDYVFLEKELRLILQQAAMFEDEVGKLTAREAELRKLVTEFQARLETLSAVDFPETVAERRAKAGASARVIAALRGLLAKIRDILSSLTKRKAKQPAAAAAAAAAASVSAAVTSATVSAATVSAAAVSAAEEKQKQEQEKQEKQTLEKLEKRALLAVASAKPPLKIPPKPPVKTAVKPSFRQRESESIQGVETAFGKIESEVKEKIKKIGKKEK